MAWLPGVASVYRAGAVAYLGWLPLDGTILGPGGDGAIHGVLDIVNTGAPYRALQRAMPIHPTVSELIPTMPGELQPAA